MKIGIIKAKEREGRVIRRKKQRERISRERSVDRSSDNREAICNRLSPHYGNCQLELRVAMYSGIMTLQRVRPS